MMNTDRRGYAWETFCTMAPSLIAGMTLAGTLVGLATWVMWQVTSRTVYLESYFWYSNGVLTILFGVLEVSFCIYVLRQFDDNDAMRPAWALLSLAALAHAGGRTLAVVGPAVASWRSSEEIVWLQNAGKTLGGPLQMVFLLWGLALVASRCAHFGIWSGWTIVDRMGLFFVAAVAVRSCFGIWVYLHQGKTVTLFVALGWLSDPSLLVLLPMAIRLRRTACSLGNGPLANCWRSFAGAVILTAVGDLSLWCLQCELPSQWVTLVWFVWLIVDASFALGPAFQAAAMARVRGRARSLRHIHELSRNRLLSRSIAI
jgi:hypothetical protein